MTDDTRDRGSGTDPTLTPAQAAGLAPTSASSLAPSGAPSHGALPPRYALGSLLGAGGMGEVLLATDQQIGRDVAIKRMRIASTAAAVARFEREARIQGRLDHPAIVPVHELATDSEGRPFFVMKRLAGTTLAEILAGPAPRPREKLLRAFAEVCLATEFAHQRGVIHRDLKPANIMLGDFGEVYVLDWGVARVIDETDDASDAAGDAGSPPSPAPADASTTEAGAILGTPGYIAPELIRGERLDARADVFALGCILFELLAGEPLLPRGRKALTAVLDELDARPSARVPDRDIPPELDDLCVEATAADRARRPTARELAERIERYLDGDRDLARRKELAATHLAAARAALALDDGEAGRATAMREAGLAIALDPHDREAARLVSRLILEPPKEVPREVEVRVEAVEEATTRQKAKLATGAVLTVFLFVPFLAWMDIHDVVGVVSLLVIAALNAVVTAHVAFARRPLTAARIQLAAITQALVVLALAYEFSPFMFAPAVAATSVVLFLIDPRVRWRPITALFTAVVLVPWMLELLGVIPRTLTATDGALVIRSNLVALTLPATEIGLALFASVVVVVCAVTARRVAVTHRAALRSIELQAWHLRQLVER